MRLVFLLALLGACEFSSPTSSTGSKLVADAGAPASATVYIPAAAGALTAGSATRTSYGAFELSSGASVAFPIIMRTGEAMTQLTAKVSCDTAGDVVSFKLAQIDTNGVWLNTGPETTSTGHGLGATQDVTLDMSAYPVGPNPNGYRQFAAVISVVSESKGIAVFGLEESLQ